MLLTFSTLLVTWRQPRNNLLKQSNLGMQLLDISIYSGEDTCCQMLETLHAISIVLFSEGKLKEKTNFTQKL
jgi:hypothetical protein